MGARAITDLDSVKSWAPSTQGVDDAVLERSLDAASALIEQFCGRRFVSADYTARHSGNLAYSDGFLLTLADPDSGLLTPNVSAVDSLTEDGAILTVEQLGGTALTDAAQAVYMPLGPALARVSVSSGLLSQAAWSTGLGNIVIAYTAGYALESVPAEIVQAAIELTWLLYREGSRSGMASRQASLGSASFFRELSPAAQSALSFHIEVTVPRTLAG